MDVGRRNFTAACFHFINVHVPKSPCWLIVKRGLVAEARYFFEWIESESIEEKIADIQATIAQNDSQKARYSHYKIPFFLAIMLAIFNSSFWDQCHYLLCT